jgi:hypothetical protein
MKSRDQVPVWWLGGISILYFVCAGLRAAYRPLWYDELVTWHVSRLPSIGAMWAAIVSGVDQEMPLMHLSVRISHALFGDGHLATRLPMLIGFWMMLMAIYWFLRKRLPWQYALIGMIFPMLTYAWPYAFEARAYGLALGGTAIALLSWQNAAEERMRPWSLVGITLGLAIVLAVQATLAVVAIPFALGEAMRSVDKRRIDLPVWLAFAGATPVVIMYPMVRSMVKHFTFAGLQPGLFEVTRFYDDALKMAIFPLLVACLFACYIGRNEPREETGRLLPRHEAAALLGFLLTPLPFFIAGRLTNQLVFFPRYGILAMVGIACWLAVLLCRIAGASRRIATAMLVVLLLWLVAARGKEAFALARDPVNTWREDWPVLEQALAKGTPVVVASTLQFLEADHYLSADLTSQLYWVTADPDVAQRYAWQPFADHVTIQDAKQFPLHAHVTSWKEFAARNAPFYLYTDAQTQWWYEVLPRDGWQLTTQSAKSGLLLYYVDRPPRAAVP